MPIFDQNDREVVRILDSQGREIETVYDQNGVIVYTNAVEMTGNMPLYFKGRGKPLTDYRISGETLQDGTPSPDMPVDVVGCGVRTENLFDKNLVTKNTLVSLSTGALDNYPDYDTTAMMDVENDFVIMFIKNASSYTLSIRVAFYDAQRNFISTNVVGSAGSPLNVTIPTGTKKIRVSYTNGSYQGTAYPDYLFIGLMVPASYIPYGYKLPITVNGTEYPIYLGQVPTTRRIKKLVLTGDENWVYRAGKPSKTFFIEFIGAHFINNSALCTHYPNQDSGSFNDLADKHILTIFASDGTKSYVGLRDSSITSVNYAGVSELKSYLAAQYANGTPVTVWYVLAEPETGIVNEPLMRIGEYADTISFAQAGVTIPTVSGANVLDMASTIKPSEVYIKGKIKPDGYGNLTDKNGVYILDKDGVQLTVHGQTDTPNA